MSDINEVLILVTASILFVRKLIIDCKIPLKFYLFRCGYSMTIQYLVDHMCDLMHVSGTDIPSVLLLHT